jgi:hypothetical protein
MKILACLVLSISSLGAGSITYFASTTFGADDVIYTEIATTAPGGVTGIQESSSPCQSIFGSGCSFGSFSLQFPQIVLPAGSTLTSAQIGFGYQWTGVVGPLTIVSVAPIIVGQPATPSSAGSHFMHEETYFQWNGDGIGLTDLNNGAFGGVDFCCADYTGPVEAALYV